VAARKLWRNFWAAATPFFLAGITAVAALGAVWYHTRGLSDWRRLAAYPVLRLAVGAVLAGATAALVLNDTGAVAWGLASLYALLAAFDTLLHDRLMETSPAGGGPAAEDRPCV
jgi:hypothetical protein